MKHSLASLLIVGFFIFAACSHESAQVEEMPGDEAVIVEEVPVVPQTLEDTITTDTLLAPGVK
jgi:hypothetical protein